MKTALAITLLTAGLATVAMAQDTSLPAPAFEGISGELGSNGADTSPPGVGVGGVAFQIDPNRNRDLERAQGVIPPSASPFYRESILNGRRSKRTQGTGFTIFNKIFGLD